MSAPLVSIERVTRSYTLPARGLFESRPRFDAVANVSLTVEAGRSMGIVGESGSGKSTLARLVMALDRPTSGRILIEGHDVHALAPRALRALRRDFQMVFQDPFGSLDPRFKVGRIVAEPLALQDDLAREDMRVRVADILQAVGLRATDMEKFPHEFSGGQRQRIALARALATRPKLIVADEPVSALDVSVQAQVLNLITDLKRDFGVTFLLISHDLAVIDHVCDVVAVMHRGAIVEQGTPDEIFTRPREAYTRMLVDAAPKM